MGLFSTPQDKTRKANLTALEDKRLRFLGTVQDFGEMLLTITERGSLRGLGLVNQKPCAIIAPELGSEEEYQLIPLTGCTYRKEPFFEAGTGFGGAFGLGQKGGVGFTLILQTEQGEWELPYIYHKSSCMICAPKKNPMLSAKRKKGDANPAWELPPIERKDLDEIEKWLDAFMSQI